jgi:hypothetical protein
MDVMTDERSHTRDRLQDCTGMVGNSRKQCRGGQHKGPLPSDPPTAQGPTAGREDKKIPWILGGFCVLG